MPEPSRRSQTQAREIYARHRGAADAWAARPRPLDAPPRHRERVLPVLLETLAWHYLGSESLQSHLHLHGWEPCRWSRLLRNLEALPPMPLEEARWGPRGRRRWNLIQQQIVRQLRHGQRLQLWRHGLLLPRCPHERVHLPRPLIATLSDPAGPASLAGGTRVSAIWNTLSPEPLPRTLDSPLILAYEQLCPTPCPCGLGSATLLGDP